METEKQCAVYTEAGSAEPKSDCLAVACDMNTVQTTQGYFADRNPEEF
jgi:hypothetical protein